MDIVLVLENPEDEEAGGTTILSDGTKIYSGQSGWMQVVYADGRQENISQYKAHPVRDAAFAPWEQNGVPTPPTRTMTPAELLEFKTAYTG